MNTQIRCHVMFTAPCNCLTLQPTAGKQHPQYPHSPPLHNTTTVPVLQVNLLPVCEDEVHLIVHTNGPRKAFKMIEWFCFGDDN